MKTLKEHEKFEMLILNEMRKLKILDRLIFGGGTMLRLCYELPRYSVDLDFYLIGTPQNFRPWAGKLTQLFLDQGLKIIYQQEKHFSFLWEIKNRDYPRKLKIEVRKEPDESLKTQVAIAFSPYATEQVRLTTLTLAQMGQNKIAALLGRSAIRDVYDLEFLARRQVVDFNSLDKSIIQKLLDKIASFKLQDYKAQLGSVLDAGERQRVLSQKFDFLVASLQACLNKF